MTKNQAEILAEIVFHIGRIRYRISRLIITSNCRRLTFILTHQKVLLMNHRSLKDMKDLT